MGARFWLAAVALCLIAGSAGVVAAEGLDDCNKQVTERAQCTRAPAPIGDRESSTQRDGVPAAISSFVVPSKSVVPGKEIFRWPLASSLKVSQVRWPAPQMFPRLQVFQASVGLKPPAGGAGGAVPDGGKQAPSTGKPNTVASTVPMTAGEKFMLFLTESFKPPAPYALSIVSGVWDEAIDSKHKKPHRSAGDFAADSLTHAARNFAFRTTSNFFEDFAYPVAFRQDPRYHRSPYTRFGAKLRYALTRVFITQGDNNGSNEFNISFLAGGLTTAALANLWEPSYRRNATDTMSRFGTHIGFRALSNILAEFIKGQ